MKEIKPLDIQKGDRVRVTNGAGTTYEGTVDHFKGCCWVDRVNDEVVCAKGVVGVPIYLIDRPMPPLPTKPVAQIIATEVRGKTGRWEMYIDNDGDWQTVNGDLIGGYYYLRPDHITAWEPIEVGK